MKKRQKNDKFPRRGHVYQVEFDPAKGQEIRKSRPAVVVSNDDMNELAGTVIVMPITGGQHVYFLRIPVVPPEGGLAKPSVVATEQLRAIDKTRIGRHLGHLEDLTMLVIEEAIRSHFALSEDHNIA